MKIYNIVSADLEQKTATFDFTDYFDEGNAVSSGLKVTIAGDFAKLRLPKWITDEIDDDNIGVETQSDLEELAWNREWTQGNIDIAIDLLDVIKAYCNPVTRGFVEVVE